MDILYFDYLPEDILMVILSKLDNIRFIHNILKINLLNLFKYKHPYLSKILYKQYPGVIDNLNKIEEYEKWEEIFHQHSHSVNYYSINGKLPNEVYIFDIIEKININLFGCNRTNELDGEYIKIILTDILNKEYKMNEHKNIIDRLYVYNINLKLHELNFFKYIVLIILYDVDEDLDYLYNYINNNIFDINDFIDTNKKLKDFPIDSLYNYLNEYKYALFDEDSIYNDPGYMTKKLLGVLTFVILRFEATKNNIYKIDTINYLVLQELRNKYKF
jgi:hypothetical protein